MELPFPLNWLKKGWMALSHAMGFVMSKIILTVLWIVGFGTYGIILKIIGLFSTEQSKESYWVDAAPETADSLRNQF